MRLPVNKLLYVVLRMLRFPVVWEVSSGVVLFRQLSASSRREYLILHYPSGHFDFPKGHVEEGETLEDAARRETDEETGIRDINIFSHRVSIRYFYEARGNEFHRRKREGRGTWIFKIVHFFPAETRAADTVRISHEHIGSLWLPFEEALAKVTFDNAKRVLSETEAYLVSRG